MMAATDVFGRVRAPHVDQIVAGGEGAPRAGEDQRAEVVKGKCIEGRVDLGEHPERERVQLLRTVQHDRGDRALSTTEDLFVIHAGLIAPSGSTRPRRAWLCPRSPACPRSRAAAQKVPWP